MPLTVTEAVALLREDRPGEKTLVAYVTSSEAQTFSAAEARRFIAAEFVPHLDRWNEAGMYDRDRSMFGSYDGALSGSLEEL